MYIFNGFALKLFRILCLLPLYFIPANDSQSNTVYSSHTIVLLYSKYQTHNCTQNIPIDACLFVCLCLSVWVSVCRSFCPKPCLSVTVCHNFYPHCLAFFFCHHFANSVLVVVFPSSLIQAYSRSAGEGPVCGTQGRLHVGAPHILRVWDDGARQS